jgi:hypothetical protein
MVTVGATGGCSGSLQTSHADAGRDATASLDRPVTPALDAHGRSDASDGGVCLNPLDLATTCPGGAQAECQPTWTEVLAHPDCPDVGQTLASFLPSEFRGTCGPYDVRRIQRVDEFSTYYYNISDGTLAAIFLTGVDGKTNCIDGPPGGIPATCLGPAWVPICSTDGGVLVDAAGSDGGGRD